MKTKLKEMTYGGLTQRQLDTKVRILIGKKIEEVLENDILPKDLDPDLKKALVNRLEVWIAVIAGDVPGGVKRTWKSK